MSVGEKNKDKDTLGIVLELPLEMAKKIQAEADRLGVNKKALIKVWIGEKLDAMERERQK